MKLDLKLLTRSRGKISKSSNITENMVKTQAQPKPVKVNYQQLFNRILCTYDSPYKLRLYLEYEFSASLRSTFDGVSLRKGTKFSLMKMYEEGIFEQLHINDGIYVLDGGFLPPHGPWLKNCTYDDVLEDYRGYIPNKYGIVLLYGFHEKPTTKNEEQNWRSPRYLSAISRVDKNTVL